MEVDDSMNVEDIRYEPADIKIFVRGKGTVIEEKSLVAINKSTGKIAAYGAEAERMEGKENIQVISPMRQGKVADRVAAEEMFRDLFRRVFGKKPLFKPAIAISMPQNMTEAEKWMMDDILIKCGAREIMVVEFPIEQFFDEMPKVLPQEAKRFRTLIQITKEEPEKYIREELTDIMQYARHQRIDLERVAGLLQELVSENPPL